MTIEVERNGQYVKVNPKELTNWNFANVFQTSKLILTNFSPIKKLMKDMPL